MKQTSLRLHQKDQHDQLEQQERLLLPSSGLPQQQNKRSHSHSNSISHETNNDDPKLKQALPHQLVVITPSINVGKWTKIESDKFQEGINTFGKKKVIEIRNHIGTRTLKQVHSKINTMKIIDECNSDDIIKGLWSNDENERLEEGIRLYGFNDPIKLCKHIGTRTVSQLERTKQWINRNDKQIDKQIYNTGLWNHKENELLDTALAIYGRENYKMIATIVTTRDIKQIGSRIRKYYTINNTVPEKGTWTEIEKQQLETALTIYDTNQLNEICAMVVTRSRRQIENKIAIEYIKSPITNEKAKILYSKHYKKIKSIRESNTIEGFYQFLKSYNSKKSWKITKDKVELYDPIVACFTEKTNDGFVAMLQIIYHGIISSTKIRFDMTQEEIRDMFFEVYYRPNHCVYCRNEADIFSSGYESRYEKDRDDSRLPYFHLKQILCSVCSGCNGLCGNKSRTQRISFAEERIVQNTHNGVRNFNIIYKELDDRRKQYRVWYSSYNRKLLNNHCTNELNHIINMHSKMKGPIYLKYKAMKNQGKTRMFTSYKQVINIFKFFGGKCSITGIQMTKGRCNLVIDRKTDDLPYDYQYVQPVYEGINNAKGCGNQGIDNNMFQNNESFTKFIKQYGKQYDLKVDDDFDDNLVKYVRRFYQGFVENYLKIIWADHTLSNEVGKKLQQEQLLQIKNSNRNDLNGIKKKLN